MTAPSASGRRIDAPALGDAVADAGVLVAAGDPGVTRAAIGVADGEQRLLEPDAGAELLARAGAVADVERVAPAHLPAVDPDALGEHVEHALHREVRLVDAEAAHRAARRVVRVDRCRLDVDVRNPVGAARVARRALEHLVADARVGAGVADDPRAHRGQMPVGVAADGVVQPHRVPLGVEAEALLPREREPHRPAGGEREQSRMPLDVQVLLGAEGAAGRSICVTRTWSSGTPRRPAIWRRSSQTPWPCE